MRRVLIKNLRDAYTNKKVKPMAYSRMYEIIPKVGKARSILIENIISSGMVTFCSNQIMGKNIFGTPANNLKQKQRLIADARVLLTVTPALRSADVDNFKGRCLCEKFNAVGIKRARKKELGRGINARKRPEEEERGKRKARKLHLL